MESEIPKKTVYIETTVPSAYATTRTDPGSLYRRELTRKWWDQERSGYELRTSEAVILELERGDWPGKGEALKIMDGVLRLAIDEEVHGVARTYIKEKLVPADMEGDAIHLAAASVQEVDFLLTWNIRHLANPNKLDHLIVVNRRLSLMTPRIVTPEMLWRVL